MQLEAAAINKYHVTSWISDGQLIVLVFVIFLVIHVVCYFIFKESDDEFFPLTLPIYAMGFVIIFVITYIIGWFLCSALIALVKFIIVMW